MGYLALMLMLQEKDEVLMLATNSLKVDLNSNNKLIASLALTALGNLGTPDMCRDLAMEVDRHLREGTPLLRKKAALCTIRILTKVRVSWGQIVYVARALISFSSSTVSRADR